MVERSNSGKLRDRVWQRRYKVEQGGRTLAHTIKLEAWNPSHTCIQRADDAIAIDFLKGKNIIHLQCGCIVMYSIY